MTVDSKYVIKQYTADGGDTYTFDTESIGETAIQVWIIRDGVREQITSTYYDLTFDNSQFPIYKRGTVKFTMETPVIGDIVSIERSTPIFNELTLVDGEPFPSEQFEHMMDRICFIQQEIEGHYCDCRAICTPPTVSISFAPPATCKIYECDAIEKVAEEFSLNYFPLLDPNFRTTFGTWDLDRFTGTGRMYWPFSGDPTSLPFTWLDNVDIFEYSEPYGNYVCDTVRGPIGWRFDTPNTDSSPRYDQSGKTGTNIQFAHDFSFGLVTKNVVWLGSPTVQSGTFMFNLTTVQSTLDNGNRTNNSYQIDIAYVNDGGTYYIGYGVTATGADEQYELPAGVDPASSTPLYLGFNATLDTGTYPEGVRYEDMGEVRGSRRGWRGYAQILTTVVVNGELVSDGQVVEHFVAETWVTDGDDPYVDPERLTWGSKTRDQTWFAGCKMRAYGAVTSDTFISTDAFIALYEAWTRNDPAYVDPDPDCIPP